MTRIQPPPASLLTNASILATRVDHLRNVRDQQLPAIVIFDHITGRGTWNNAEKNKQDPLDRIGDYFTKDGKPFAHYTVCPWGSILQVAYERERPWAQGLSDNQMAQEPPDFWKEYWRPRGINNVRQLMQELYAAYGTPYTGRRLRGSLSPNSRAIAIEHIQYGNGFKLTAAQYRMSHILHMDIAIRHGMDVAGMINWKQRLQVLGHEDVDPWGRGARGAGWDPGALRKKPRFCWRCLLTLDFTHGGQFKRCPAIRKTPEMPGWLKKKRGLK